MLLGGSLVEGVLCRLMRLVLIVMNGVRKWVASVGGRARGCWWRDRLELARIRGGGHRLSGLTPSRTSCRIKPDKI